MRNNLVERMYSWASVIFIIAMISGGICIIAGFVYFVDASDGGSAVSEIGIMLGFMYSAGGVTLILGGYAIGLTMESVGKNLEITMRNETYLKKIAGDTVNESHAEESNEAITFNDIRLPRL